MTLLFVQTLEPNVDIGKPVLAERKETAFWVQALVC